jgi:hypothetical protein
MKKIAVITATRAEYGLLSPVIKALRKRENPEFRTELIVTGTHLSEEYGYTVREIDDRIDREVVIPVKSAAAADISANQAEALVKFTEVFAQEQYDAVILLGDRYEMLAIAIAAGNTRTPVFHLCGGDTTEGAADEWIRHSITKISTLHFVTNEASRKRVIQLGEDPGRVFNYGSTSIDNILREAGMTKAEALDLPPITEETRSVELEPKTMRLYKELADESFASLNPGDITAVNILTRMLRLSQLTGGFVGDDNKLVHQVSTAKMEALMDIVDSVMEDGKKLVIMARFVPEMDAVIAMLEKKGIGYAQVRGGVKDRAEEVRRFQEDADCKVFIGQIAAAGLGLTLTAADTMVFYSLDYSMSNFTQAQARIHRIGAQGTCHYIYLLAQGTIDEKVMKALQGKVDLAKALIDDYRSGRNPFNL